MNSKDIFPKLQSLKVHNIAHLSQQLHEDMPLLECVRQLPPTLTELDITNCPLSAEMQEDFQVRLVIMYYSDTIAVYVYTVIYN